MIRAISQTLCNNMGLNTQLLLSACGWTTEARCIAAGHEVDFSIVLSGRSPRRKKTKTKKMDRLDPQATDPRPGGFYQTLAPQSYCSVRVASLRQQVPAGSVSRHPACVRSVSASCAVKMARWRESFCGRSFHINSAFPNMGRRAAQN